MKYVLLLFAIIGGMLYGWFAYGTVGLILYEWFILPKFPMLPMFDWKGMMGIGIFTSYFFKGGGSDNINWFALIAGPWVVLFFAWLFKTIFL